MADGAERGMGLAVHPVEPRFAWGTQMDPSATVSGGQCDYMEVRAAMARLTDRDIHDIGLQDAAVAFATSHNAAGACQIAFSMPMVSAAVEAAMGIEPNLSGLWSRAPNH